MQTIHFKDIKWDEIRDYVTQGGIIAYPTEGVYGLGGLATHPEVPHTLQTLKRKESAKGIITLTEQFEDIAHWVAMPIDALAQWLDPWPEHTTLIFPASDEAPKGICYQNALAIRVPDYHIPQTLCHQLGPLLSTSANITGHPPPSDAQAVIDNFKQDDILLIIGPNGPYSKPSTIIDVGSKQTLRS